MDGVIYAEGVLNVYSFFGRNCGIFEKKMEVTEVRL